MSNLAEAQRTAGAADGGGEERETGLVGFLRLVDAALARVEEVALSICLAVLIGVGVYGAVKSRFFPPSPYWISEIVRYSVFFLGLTGAALAAQSDRLFNIDMFTRMLSPRGKLGMRILSAAFTVAVCVLLFQGSLELHRILAGENEGEIIKSEVGVLSLPIGIGLIAAHLVLHILIDVTYLVTGKLPPELAQQAPKA